MASTFYVRIRGEQRGPIGVSALKVLASGGELAITDLVSRDGKEWCKASEVKGLAFPEPKGADAPQAIHSFSNGATTDGVFDPAAMEIAPPSVPPPTSRSPLNLMGCPDCSGLVSLRAVSCPHCGCPIHAPGQSNVQQTPAPIGAMTRGQGSIIILLLLMALGFPFMSWFRPVQKWEYHIASPKDTNWRESVDDLGANGWELVSARRATSESGDPSYEMIFRRAKSLPF